MHAKVEEPLRELGCFNLGAIFTGSNKTCTEFIVSSVSEHTVSISTAPFRNA